MATEFVIRNTQERPDKAGVVRPYLTRMFNGRQYPVTFTEQQLGKLGDPLGEPEPVPEGMETVPVHVRDTHGLLEALIREQTLTRDALERIGSEFVAEVRALRPQPRLSRWYSFKLRLYFWLRRHFRLRRR